MLSEAVLLLNNLLYHVIFVNELTTTAKAIILLHSGTKSICKILLQ